MTYLSEVLADSPRNYWRLADGSSAILHDIGSDPHHMGSNFIPNGGYSGIESGGGSQYAFAIGSMLDAVINTTSPITIECWVWILYTNGKEMLPFEVPGGNISGGYELSILSSGKAFFRGNQASVTAATALTTQHWHHLVGTYDEAHVILYVDGANAGSAVKTGHVSALQQGFIGSAAANFEPLTGFITECALYPTALSSARVSAHFAAAATTTGPPVGGLAQGTFSFSTGSSTLNQQQLNDILASVRKTF